jgi:thiol-disulfide isomerase/thioredoxin
MKQKQLYVLGLLLLIFLGSCTQSTTFEINGTIEGVEDGSEIKLRNRQAGEWIATTKVKNGKFQFTGSVEQPHLASIFYGGKRFRLFILENTDYTIYKGLYNDYVKGGEINNVVFGYLIEDEYQQIVKENGKLGNPFDGIDLMDKEAVAKARKITGKMIRTEQAYKRKYQRNILEGDYSTLIKMFTLGDIVDWDNYAWERKLELFDEYEKELGAHPYIVKQRQLLHEGLQTVKVGKSVAVGQPFKEIIAENKAGEQQKLSEVVAKNKYTLLEMWASWCGPCRSEFPHLKKAYEHYHKKGFEIFALSIDSKEKAWLKALKEENVPWINVVDYKGPSGEAPKAYGVQGVPASFLIDQEGTIVASGNEVRGLGLDEKLKELFAE